MESFEGKVAVVTGAASGIGRALSEAFAVAGASVVMADVEPRALDEASETLAATGADVLAVRTDVSDAAQVEALRDAAVERFGAVHVLCNNAGVSTAGRTWEQSVADWEWVLGVNLWGVIHGIRAFTPLLLEQGEGHIVNTASIAGLLSPPFMSVYNASRHAVVALSEALHGELAMTDPEVGVSVLCPGWVATRIHESDRNRPEAPADLTAEPPQSPFGEGVRDAAAALIAAGLPPAEVADLVLDAIRTRRFYVLTHPDWTPLIAARTERIVAGENPSLAMLPMDTTAPPEG